MNNFVFCFELQASIRSLFKTDACFFEGHIMRKSEKEACLNERNVESIILETPRNGASVRTLNDDVRAFIIGYKVGNSEIYAHKGDTYAPSLVILKWSSSVDANEFEVSVSHTKDFSTEESYLVKDTSFALVAPFYQKKYFWRVRAFLDGVSYTSETFFFVLSQVPKCIFIEGVSNTREVFGYVGGDGMKIGRGLLFRGGNVDSITEDGKRFVKERLKFRTDLDLRKDGEGTARESLSPMGEGIKHLHSSGCMYTSKAGDEAGKEGIDTPQGKQKLVDALQVFADEKNFPIYVHCVLGRDRTGTLIAVLLALCGVSREDITYDYELSFFSEIACGKKTDVAKLMGYINNTLDYLFLLEGATLQEKTTNFLLQAGMEREQLIKIQANLLRKDTASS